MVYEANLIASRYECRGVNKRCVCKRERWLTAEWRCPQPVEDNQYDVVRMKHLVLAKQAFAINIILRLTRYWFSKSMRCVRGE
ncbi:hypothetical protein TNCV_4474431 [Trichonephila clavipes]|nr:hypothetical protein TNCV_4474431 [Trichonephila clavipes]